MQDLNWLNFWFSKSEGYIEFRFIGKEGVQDKRFVHVNDLHEELLERFINKGIVDNSNVYFGVSTRSEHNGMEKYVQCVPGLWVDIDPKHAPIEEAIKIVTELPTPPTVIVSSGNGIHAYFKFSRPITINSDEMFIKLKELSIRMHKYTNADSTSDLSRMMRLPGSLNVKLPAKPLPCNILEFSGAIYSIDDFDYLSAVEITPPERIIKKEKIEGYETIDLDDIKVPIYIRKLIVEGDKKGSRSEKVFAVTCSLLEFGHSPSEVAFVLTNPDWGISEKVLERPNQHQLPYIENVVHKALQRINEGEINKQIKAVKTTEIFIKDGCYYRGEKRLSNFTFQLTERILLHSNEILKGEIIVQDGTRLTILLDHKSLITKKELLTAINSSKVSWLGGDIEIQYLREFLLTKKVIEKIGVNKLGLHDRNFVTFNKIINYKGIVNDSKLVYVPKFLTNTMDLERSITIDINEEWQQLAQKLLTHLPKINQDEVIYPIIGWHFVVPIAPLIRDLADGSFPQLMMWGTKGAGKTSTAQVFGKLFGNKEVRSCSRPPFSIMREMDLLNAVPLYLDEYRPSSMSRDYLNQIKSFALNAYKGIHDSRGLQNQGTVDYQYTAPIAWIGETPFQDSNLLERVIMAKLTPNAFLQNKNYKIEYRELNKLELSSFFGGYVQWLLKKVENEEVNLVELYHMHKENIDASYDLPERVSTNITIVLMGISLFLSLAEELGLDINIPFDKVINSEVGQLLEKDSQGSLDRLMRHTATMVASSKDYINENDYTYNSKSGELIIRTERWFAELRKYCRDYNYFEDIVTDKQIRNFLLENKEQNGYVIESSSAKRKISLKVQRCTIIDAYQLERDLGISIDTWIR